MDGSTRKTVALESINIRVVAVAGIVALIVVLAVFYFVVRSGDSEPVSDDPSPRAVSGWRGEPESISLAAGETAILNHESGAQIAVPAGATADDTTISITEIEPPDSDVEVGRVFDFSVGDVLLFAPSLFEYPTSSRVNRMPRKSWPSTGWRSLKSGRR